jgi:hypothetical protein
MWTKMKFLRKDFLLIPFTKTSPEAVVWFSTCNLLTEDFTAVFVLRNSCKELSGGFQLLDVK